MGELGERLRQAREAKGVSLAEIAAQTKIGVRMLQALETEQFDQLPGGVFNRSFLRQYASFLGLEQENFVQDYLRRLEPRREVPAEASAPKNLPGSVAGSRALPWTLGGAALALLVASILFFPSRRDRSSNETPELAATPEIAPSREAAAPVASSSSVSETGKPAETSSAASGDSISTAERQSASGRAAPVELAAPTLAVTEPVASPARPSATILQAVDPAGGQVLVLQISARSTVWLSITADGAKLWQGTLQPDQSREVEATDSIRVTVGNAGGVEMTLNGESLGALGQEGEVRTITLAAGSQRDPAF